jgi:L-fucose mutarotase
MLKGPLIHPPLLAALAEAGHGSLVLLADGNYPVATATSPAATRIHLNLGPGTLDVTTVLRAVLHALPVEGAHVMTPDDGPEPPIFAEFRDLLSGQVAALQPLSRAGFYEAARGPDLAVVIATGDVRLYANLLLTIGVVPPGDALAAAS